MTPVTAVCDAGHEALTEGVRETPHHLLHALLMQLERLAKEKIRKQQMDNKHYCVCNIALIVVTVLLNQ